MGQLCLTGIWCRLMAPGQLFLIRPELTTKTWILTNLRPPWLLAGFLLSH